MKERESNILSCYSQILFLMNKKFKNSYFFSGDKVLENNAKIILKLDIMQYNSCILYCGRFLDA